MDGLDRLRRRKSLQERLGLKGMVCCGATWGFGPSTMSVRDDSEENDPTHQEHEQLEIIDVSRTLPENTSDPDCLPQSSPSSAVSGMNLAAALAAERNFRPVVQDPEPFNGSSPNRLVTAEDAAASRNLPSGGVTSAPGTPFRVSLVRLLSESDGLDEKEEKCGTGGSDQMCCVCMGRKKGAAFIPCGHTFCRVCSRELWLNRGSCPLCNRSILEILDIY